MKRTLILGGCALAVCLFSLLAADPVLAAASCSAECTRGDCSGNCAISSQGCSVSCVGHGCVAQCTEYKSDGAIGSCIWGSIVYCPRDDGPPGGPDSQGFSQPAVSGWSVLSSGRDGVQELAASSVATGVLSVLDAQERLKGGVVRITPAPQREYTLDVRPEGRCLHAVVEFQDAFVSFPAGEENGTAFRGVTDRLGNVVAVEILYSLYPGLNAEFADVIKENMKVRSEETASPLQYYGIVKATDDGVDYMVLGASELY